MMQSDYWAESQTIQQCKSFCGMAYQPCAIYANAVSEYSEDQQAHDTHDGKDPYAAEAQSPSVNTHVLSCVPWMNAYQLQQCKVYWQDTPENQHSG